MIFQKLNNFVEPCNALIGFGFIRAKDYDKDKLGHLLMLKINYKKINISKKLFIRI